MRALGRFERKFDPHRPWPHRVQLVLSADNMNTKVSGRESLNGAAEPGRDLLEIDVFDGTKSVRAKNRCNANRLTERSSIFLSCSVRSVSNCLGSSENASGGSM